MRYLFLFFSMFSVLFGERSTTSVTENDPSSFVEGVSMITGDFCTNDEFYTVQGAEPIRFKSIYLTKGLFLTGQEHFIATYFPSLNLLQVMEPNGTIVGYQENPVYSRQIDKCFYRETGKKKKRKPVTYRTLQFHQTAQGVSNTASGRISGQTHLKNQKVVFDPNIDPKGQSFTLYAADGTIRRYAGLQSQPKTKIPYSGFFKDYEEYQSYQYKLLAEELPNGHVIHYEWSKNNKLLEIRATNRSGKKVFTKIRIPYVKIEPSHTYCSMSGSDGKIMAAQYQPSFLKNQVIYAQIFPPEQPDRSYTWTSRKRWVNLKDIDYPYLSSLSQPNGRVLKLEYDGGDSYGIPRVASLSSPVGKDSAPLVTHRFFYHHQNSYVLDIDGNKTSYAWNGEDRLTSICKFIGTDHRHSEERFVWNKTFLTCKSFFDQNKKCLHARTLTYDDWGNVTKNTLHGNLSGQGSDLRLSANQMPLPGSESCSTHSVYSQDGKNLLLRIEDPNGLVVLFTYLVGTNLIQSKTLCNGATPKIFYTYEYDEDFLLVRETVDDGVMSTIKRITPKQTDPFIGMPEIIEEKYLDCGREILLKKTVLHYRKGALIEHKDVYDANGVFQYRLSYEYDEKNRIISETNAAGQKAQAIYDLLGNRSFYRDPSGRTEQTNAYDYANRLIESVFTGEKISLKKEYSYNTKHHLEWESDERGHKTYYKYNLLGQRTETILPPLQTEIGKFITPIIRQEYDAAGNEIARIDAEGHRTETKYNAYGKPIHVIHPNGLEEHFVYTLSGDLISHIDVSGVETRYKYDYLRHIVEKAIFSLGKELSKETYSYTGHHLVSKTDAEGNITLYTYDKAGRKTSETFAGETTRYEYDALGRIFRFQERAEITTRTFDLLDRILEEQHQSLSGELLKKTCYEYDSAGNKTATIFFTENGAFKETSVYDALNRVIEKTNAEGFKEKFTYEDILNEHGQKVLQKTHTDAMGLQTIETLNTHGRTSKIEKRKSKTLALTEKFYTERGHLALQRDTIFAPDSSTRNSCVRWEYDAMGREIKLIEAADTLNAKITKKMYTPRGELQKLIKPDGVEVFYEYNNLNQLISIQSSDRTVNHHMSYNRLGHLQTSDGLTRVTDAKGRILRENFPAGHKILNTFDSTGRRASCTIPDADCLIEYAYEGYNLSAVSRKTLDGKELYSHQYLKRDLSRHILEERLIGDQGLVKHSFDRMARRVKVKTHHFSQEILSFDPVGNILSTELQGQTIDYAYDDLYQLIKETGFFAHDFSYDSMYNRLTKDAEDFEINALNQVVSHLEYNPNGCPTSQGSTKYFYDALDRLIQIATPTCIQLFGYDSFHRCLYKVVIQESGEKTLYFLYDGQKEIGSFDPLQKISELRILGSTPEAERGAAIAVELDKKVFAPLHDLQGNLTALIPIDGTIPTFYRYSAFGEEKIYGTTLSPWRFSSKRSDAETKLVYYGRRFYMSDLGRWLTPDPAGFTDGMNLYAFLQNGPLMKMDLYGLFAWGSGSTRDFSQNYSWNKINRPAYADYGSSSWSAPFLAKGPSSSSATSPAPYRSKIFPPLDPNSTGSPHYVVNGILNKPDGCMESALGIHESCKKISNVIPVYSATAGALKDLYTVMQCRYNRSYTNEFIEMFRGEIISVATEMDRRKDDRKIFISAFSRAVGETFFVVKDLPLEVKNRLIITCCGGVLVMPRDCGFIVRNYISEGDWPSRKVNGLRGDPEKIKEMLEMHNEHADLTMLPQEDSNGLGDHFSQSKAYQKIRGKDTFGLYQEYGISK